MKISHDGARRRYYADRQKQEAAAGFPLEAEVSTETRARIIRYVRRHSTYVAGGVSKDFEPALREDLREHFGGSTVDWSNTYFDHTIGKFDLDEFLQMLEMAAERIIRYRSSPVSDINVINSLLADDSSAFRLVNVGDEKKPLIHVQKIDNEHLHMVLTDRTFELTRIAEFASAQNDYAVAWKHFSTGELSVAVTNAGKAVESACKVVIKKVDPNSTPENMNLGPLVGLLVDKDIIPAKLVGVSNHLEQIYRASGGFRNEAGKGAHGSVDVTTPEASTALLALRMSGTLISFLAERWLQMKP